MDQTSAIPGIDWGSWEPTMRANLLFVIEGGKVLLIRKKTGLGQGKINGPGGKLEPGETAVEAAVREIREELHLEVDPADCEAMGVLRFQFVDGLALHVVVFRTFRYGGTPTETREAAPLWFSFDDIPFEEMWADDRYWLREMLDGRYFAGDFLFDGEEMLWRELRFLGEPGSVAGEARQAEGALWGAGGSANSRCEEGS